MSTLQGTRFSIAAGTAAVIIGHFSARPVPFGYLAVGVTAIGICFFFAGLSSAHRLLIQTRMSFGRFLVWLLTTQIGICLMFSVGYLGSAMAGLSIQYFGTQVYATHELGRSWFDCFYLSGITGLTVGYGDVVPVGYAPRLLALANAFVGPVFFASVIVIGIGSGSFSDDLDPRPGASSVTPGS